MTTRIFVRPYGFDRHAIMRNAHKRFRDGRRLGLGWTFAQCLRTAWAAARIQRQSDITATTMGSIARRIDDHISRRIDPVIATRTGRTKAPTLLRLAS